MAGTLPGAVIKLLGSIRAAGGQAFVVGDAVREVLCGRTPTEWEVAATLTPEELLGIFPYARLVGSRAVLVRWNSLRFTLHPCREEERLLPGERVEIRPNILTELARRDFTVNAMALAGGVLLDPFGGQRDLQAGTLRCVGSPAVRFGADRACVLRLLGTAADLGFRVEERTAEAARAAMQQVGGLPREQVRSEVNRILLGRRPFVLAQLVTGKGLCRYGFYFAPELRALARVPALPVCRWWAFATLCGVDVMRMGGAFGFSPRFISELCAATALYHSGPARDDKALRRKLKNTLLDYEPMAAAFAALNPAFAREQALFAGVRMRGEAFRVEDMQLTEADLVAEGLERPRCGEVLLALLDRVIEQPWLNQREALLDMARGLM